MTAVIPVDLALRLYRTATGLQPQVRDMGALESSLSRPAAAFAGTPFYSTIHEKAAALMESVNRNHPLVDGNKRLSLALVVALYRSHDLRPLGLPSPQETDDFVRQVAAGTVSLEEIATWLSRVFVPASG